MDDVSRYESGSRLSMKHSVNDDIHPVKSLERPLFYDDSVSHSAVVRDGFIQP